MSQPPAHRRVRVDLGPRSYDVVIGPGALATVAASAQDAAGPLPDRRILIAADDALPASVIDVAADAFRQAGARVHRAAVRAGEDNKTLARAEDLHLALSDAGFERADLLVALGGGMLGDLAGFVAGTYQRGMPWVQCPTTLLSMVDASVGGKTAVNLVIERDGVRQIRKNMVGLVHQPRAVIADVSLLASLPDRAFRSGLAECVKHGMLAASWGQPDLFERTEEHLDAVLARDTAALVELITRNVNVKARVVAADEREDLDRAQRAQLNLGHTFGHALEGVPGLSPDGRPSSAPLQHGEAVALGLLAASHCAAAAGLCPAGVPQRVEHLVARCGLPVRIPGIPPTEALIARMMHDKKVAGGKLRLVLPVSLGACVLSDSTPRRAVEAGIDALRA